MTKKFICVTQSDHLTNFIGPSGTSYESLYGHPIVVELPQDVEYFSKKRQFEEVGLFKKPKLEPAKDAPTKLGELLTSLNISKKSVTTLVDAYVDENVLLTEIEGGNDLTGDISKTDAKKVVNHFLNEEEPSDDSEGEE